MNKIKGLLTEIKENQQASIMILPFNTRIQDYQKVLKRLTQIYDKVFLDPYMSLINELSLLNMNSLEDIKLTKNKPSSFYFLLDTFLQTQKNWKNMNLQIKTYLDQGFNGIIEQLSKIGKIKDTLYDKLEVHEIKENQLVQTNKKYIKVQKLLIQAIESYKIAFQDVKLIYNLEEKAKRYKSCASHFTSAVSINDQISKNIEFLMKERQQLKIILEELSQKQEEFVRIVGRQLIKIPMNLTKCMMRSKKELLNRIRERVTKLKEDREKNIFQKFRLPFPNPEYFECQLKQEQTQLYPSYLANLKHLKIQYFGKCKKFLIEYYVSTRDDIKQRLAINQSIKNYLQSLVLIFDKIFTQQQKDLKDSINQKYLKIIQNYFYLSFSPKQSTIEINSPTKDNKIKPTPKFSETSLTILSFLDQQKELIKNMNKFYTQYVKQLIGELDGQKDSLNLFKEEFKSRFYSLFIGKKQFKKDLEIMKSGQIQELSLSEDQVKESRDEILKKIDFILMIVKGFSDKSKISSQKIKSIFQLFLSDYYKHITYEINLCQKQNEQFDDLIQTYIQFGQKSTEDAIEQNKWIRQNSLYKSIVKQNLKIKYDSQIQKVNEFKKLKKPTPDFQDSQISTLNTTTRSLNSSVIQGSPSKSSSSFQLPFSKNYQKFVKEKTHFEEGQQYVSNFACGLCDNIIVSGRLYVTTNRLFFHSRFNSSNIFFGETKLQIPRTDILKIQKKYNAIIFDNSISVTTCNGQIFFTSLVSRDQAYDIICKTFQIDNNKAVFQPQTFLQDTQQTQQNFSLNISQEDDLGDDQVEKRALLIDEMIENDEKSDQKTYNAPYQNVLNETLKFPGLTAAKVLKIFESGQQFPYKGKTYESFWDYFKGNVHKNFDIDYEEWEPRLLQFINPSNIKKTSPLKFSRKIDTNVPAPETSIPFMPKFIRSCEAHELYLYSRDKFVVIIKVHNSKAPYTDCFHIRIKKTIEKTAQDCVKIEMQLKLIFIKKTMVQGMIQSRTLKQSRENNVSMFSEMQNYLKYLQRKLIKHDQTLTNGEKASQRQQVDQSVSIDTQKQRGLRQSKSDEKSEISKDSLGKSIFKWGFIFSIILNFILLSIIFYSDKDL